MRIVNQRYIKVFLIAVAAITALAIFMIIGHAGVYRDRIYPGIRVNNLYVGGMTVREATVRTEGAFAPTGQVGLVFKKNTAKVVDQPPVDATLLISANSVNIKPHQEGRRLLYTKTLDRLRSQIDNNTKEVRLAVKVWQPTKTTEDIKKLRVEKLVAEF